MSCVCLALMLQITFPERPKRYDSGRTSSYQSKDVITPNKNAFVHHRALAPRYALGMTISNSAVWL